MQAPGWLPYRVRARWDQARVRAALRGLGRTPPSPAHDLDDADVELHMLVCRRDVALAVFALKSLLRFEEARPAVTLTDDGSLRPRDRAWIDRHVPGSRWLPRRSGDPRVLQALDGFPNLRTLYESGYHPICKLIHPVILGETSRVIVLDPDTAFFKRPTLLIDWCGGAGSHGWFLHDHQDEGLAVPRETRDAFAELRGRLAPDGREWHMPYYFFNSGLLAYHRDQADLAFAERYLEWLATAPERYRAGKAGLWFGAWTPEQTAYQVMFALMAPRPEPLTEEYRIGAEPGYTFNHFLWLQLIRPEVLRRLRELVGELGTGRGGD